MNTNYSWFTQPAARNRGFSKPNPEEISLIDSLSSWFNKPAQNNRGMSTQEAIQQYNPPSIQNGKFVQGTPIQEQASSAVNNENIPSIQTSPFKDPSLVDAQLNALFRQTQPTTTKQSKTNILGERVPMQNLDSGVGYVNGKLLDSNKTSFSGLFDGYSKERDTAIDTKTGRIDRNSEFYKRNKKAMSNLGKPIEQESQAQQQNNTMVYDNPTSASINFKTLSPSKPRKFYGVF